MESLTKCVSKDCPDFAVYMEDDDKVCYAYLWKERENIITHVWLTMFLYFLSLNRAL